MSEKAAKPSDARAGGVIPVSMKISALSPVSKLERWHGQTNIHIHEDMSKDLVTYRQKVAAIRGARFAHMLAFGRGRHWGCVHVFDENAR